MNSPRWILYHIPLSIYLILCGFTLTFAQQDFWDSYCTETNNYTQNSAYRQSLDDALFALTGTDNGYGYYNYTAGRLDGDSATALALCRGDTPPDVCRRCVDDSTRRLRQVCQVEKEATGWYDVCALRYSDRTIRQTLEHGAAYTRVNTSDVPEQFTQALSVLIDSLMGEAARGGSFRKYASGSRNYTSASENSTVYAFMQCTPDISESECNLCLQNVSQLIPSCCNRKAGGRLYRGNCILRYEDYLFYNVTWYPPPPPPPGKGGTTNIALIVAPTVAAVGLMFILVFFVRHSLRRKRKRRGNNLVPEVEAYLGNNSIGSSKYQIDKDETDEMNYFDLRTILAATNNFSAANKLGEGGFGPVYKGILQDGKEIAVKRLSRNSGQGFEEFRTEVRLMIKLQHKNLVRILGCCVKGDEKLLVYEYMVNTSLDVFLFDPTKREQLDWPTRANIVSGIAKGLRYLHEDSRQKIVHRDMKASNVLLDDDMNPKISDFGTARTFGSKQVEANTIRVVGTLGYMAPEYAMEGIFSTKSDVYSFGVLLLEIISGKKNSGFHDEDQFQSLPSYAWQLWKDDKGDQLIDQNLIGGCPVMEALRCINVGLLCVQGDPQARPTMSSVVFMLEGQMTSLPQPLVPPFSIARLTFRETSSIIGTETMNLVSDQYSSTTGTQTVSIVSDRCSTTGTQTVSVASGQSSTTATQTVSIASDQPSAVLHPKFRRNETS